MLLLGVKQVILKFYFRLLHIKTQNKSYAYYLKNELQCLSLSERNTKIEIGKIKE